MLTDMLIRIWFLVLVLVTLYYGSQLLSSHYAAEQKVGVSHSHSLNHDD